MNHRWRLYPTMNQESTKIGLARVEDRMRQIQLLKASADQLKARQERRLARVKAKPNQRVQMLPIGGTTILVHDRLATSRYYFGHKGGDYIFRYASSEYLEIYEKCSRTPPDSETGTGTDSDEDLANQTRTQTMEDSMHAPLMHIELGAGNNERNLADFTFTPTYPEDLMGIIPRNSWLCPPELHRWIYHGQVPRSVPEYGRRLLDMIPILTTLFVSLMAFDENRLPRQTTDDVLMPILEIWDRSKAGLLDPTISFWGATMGPRRFAS
ncbi:hypothetical protein CDD82_7872 [Ophiocordyceps australis]|uniref:Uncharacterized protein n=1 Tax=Ophiocordyceps australis TaxID=1399860 RepID=A0A2C5YKH7_9HYPO|nr:hypothetical protein CDD82_7872 [Ophiocordyceps australis]